MTQLGRQDTVARVKILFSEDVDAALYFLIYLGLWYLLIDLVITRQVCLKFLLQVDKRIFLEFPLTNDLVGEVLIFLICINLLLLKRVVRFRGYSISAFLCWQRILSDLVQNKIFTLNFVLQCLI